MTTHTNHSTRWKALERFSFHRHMEPARKYCKDGDIPALVTKEAGQVGEYATVPLDWLAGILDRLRKQQRGGV